ncbi:MAG: DedA family protein [Candidatus Aenigmarchaeota archaeon]|nr:DedA family protein [Candidatus Aenigmarchaeota archaeon]
MHRIVHKVYGLHLYATGGLRKLYDWVVSWGHTKYGTIALFVVAFVESSFFPIPPDVLIICLCVANSSRAFWYATVSTVGSVIGGLFGYFIGYAFYETLGKPIITALHYEVFFEAVGQSFQDNAFLAIFGAGLTPIPYKVFTIAAGFWKINIPVFVVASIFGRASRFFLVAGLLYFFGKRISTFIDKYFNMLSFAVFVLVIVGFVALRYV